jgi:hypothetical protein
VVMIGLVPSAVEIVVGARCALHLVLRVARCIDRSGMDRSSMDRSSIDRSTKDRQMDIDTMLHGCMPDTSSPNCDTR